MTGPGGALRSACSDLAAGLSRHWFWTRLGWNDVRRRFSGSLLGSFWITANLALMVAALSFVFAGPLGARWSDYLPFVAAGVVLWQFIQGSLNEASNVFVAAGDTIRNAPMPLSVHVLRLIWRNLLILAHNAVILVAVLAIFRVRPDATLWTLALAVPLLGFAMFWTCLLLGLLGARFRDVSPIVANLLQILFFVTPVFWPPEALGPARQWLVACNPVFALVDIVRAPLLGVPAAPASWPIAGALACVAAGCGLAALAHLRVRIPYWI